MVSNEATHNEPKKDPSIEPQKDKIPPKNTNSTTTIILMALLSAKNAQITCK